MLLRMEAGLGQGPRILGTLSSWCPAPQEGMGWNGLCLQPGLNLPITTQRWKLGDHGVLGKILLLPWPRARWECCIPGMGSSCCLELLGCSRHRTQPACTAQGTASPQPCSLGLTAAENSPSALPPASVPWLFSGAFEDHELSPQPPSPRGSRHGASSSPVPGSPGQQLADCSPTNKGTGPPPAPTALPGGADLEESPCC